MALTLSAEDVRRLAAATRALVSPLASASVEAWRAWVNDAVATLLGADSALFMLPLEGERLQYSAEVSPDVMRSYVEHFIHIDEGGRRRAELGLAVWNRAMLWDPTELQRTEYYNDFAAPNRFFDSLGMTVDLPGERLPASLYFHHAAPYGRQFGERGLALLHLLFPAFQAGVQLAGQLTKLRLGVPRMVDLLSECLLVLSPEGELVHVNVACEDALAAEPERARLIDEARELARTLGGPLVRARADSETTAVLQPARQVRTAAGEYRLVASLLGEEPGVVPGTVVVSVQRAERTRSDAVAVLRARYGLTERECDVALLLAKGRSNDAIAGALGVSPHTARHHTHRVMTKLAVGSRAEAGSIIRETVARSSGRP